MSSNHLISTVLSSIKNAGAVGIKSIKVPYSNVVLHVLEIMKEEGFVSKVQAVEVSKGIKQIEITLKYVMGRHSIQSLHVVSKPGRRVYSSIADLRPYYDGLGFSIISTSKGVMTNSSAAAIGIGGEILCQIF